MPPLTKYFLGLPMPDALRAEVLDFRAECAWKGEEPHITLKAPCGLDASERWLEPAQQICQASPPVNVQIHSVGNFGSSVLYLKVDSPELVHLHKQLVSGLGISLADQSACFEGLQYVPHLTLMQKQESGMPFEQLVQLAAERFKPCSFTATSLTVYKKTQLETFYKVYQVLNMLGEKARF